MTENGRIVIVGGVPGVGKTTVINHVLKLAEEEGVKIQTIVFGTVMMEIAKEKYNIERRDMLRKLSAKHQKEIQRQAAIRIAEKAKGKITIVDTHFMIRTGAGYFLPGMPKWVSDELQPRLLVLIETQPKEIPQRRVKDGTRTRDADVIDLILDHQEINKSAAVAISQRTGALVSIIENKQGKAAEAGRELFEQLKRLGEES